ncbi:hypothetical protein OQX61_21815 [Pedobacter sp. PLR]|uniref:hypothetical protein n=1 Tax=Pedobacter sp. PLR TaxID=2994465 RepID=UPI0022477274|nr:hypothetical protein [Pedobacter sp. PLR]MCX2453920.1 hypothetical protein [Pedobacter sp. PLR]
MAAELQQLTTGKYLFFGKPARVEGQNIMVVEFSGTALGITNSESVLHAAVQEFDISPLLSKTSTHILEEKPIEAHKLYTWPANLGDPKAWASSKQLFFEQHLMNQPIEVLNVQENQQITWRFIPVTVFRALAEEAQAVTLLSGISTIF